MERGRGTGLLVIVGFLVLVAGYAAAYGKMRHEYEGTGCFGLLTSFDSTARTHELFFRLFWPVGKLEESLTGKSYVETMPMPVRIR